MRYLKLLFLFILCGIVSCTTNARSAVTYKRNGGRFGDDLFTYSRAKSISLQYNIPLLFKPIYHSENLMIRSEPFHYTQADEKNFKKIVPIGRGKSVQILPEADILYVSEFDPSINLWDENLVQALKKMIVPVIKIEEISLPENMITVAMHVRTGKGFDRDESRRRGKLKFPQFEFYIKQLQALKKRYPDQNLYVYIFTDDPQPESIVERLQKSVGSEKIVYDFRKQNNRHDKNVLDDFFNLMNFDILIYPLSGFSIFAQLLGKNKIAIRPSNVVVKTRDVWIVSEVEIKTRQEDGTCLSERILV